MAEESKKSSGKGWLIAITIILFIINAWKFINNPGSEVPILSILFNMIIYLAIIFWYCIKMRWNLKAILKIIVKN